MRLSESLRKNIMVTAVGGILNKFKGKSRRTTLFFEDILANYIKTCEDSGYGNKMREIGERWGSIGTKQLSTLRIFQSTALLNQIAKIAWLNVGLMDDFKLTKQDNKVSIETKNEFITRLVGKNEFMAGVFGGCLSSYFGKRIKNIQTKSNQYTTRYAFEITEESFDARDANKKKYDKMNKLPTKQGFVLKNGLKSNIFTLKSNKIYFRKKSLIPVENTIFHILGNENILMDQVPQISHSFFKELVDKTSPPEKKIMLLKTLLQTMGWCTVNILYNTHQITMKLEHLPVSLQTTRNNWTFLVNVIAGYLRIIDTKFVIEKTSSTESGLCVVFAKAN